MSGVIGRGRAWGVGLALALAVSGCSDDPAGPGTVDLAIRGPVPLGAAVVELVGAGIEGVEQPAQGWAELVPMPPDGSTPVHRLVVIQERPGELAVRLRVADVESVLLAATVVEASDQADAVLPSLSGVEVRVRR